MNKAMHHDGNEKDITPNTCIAGNSILVNHTSLLRNIDGKDCEVSRVYSPQIMVKFVIKASPEGSAS